MALISLLSLAGAGDIRSDGGGDFGGGEYGRSCAARKGGGGGDFGSGGGGGSGGVLGTFNLWKHNLR